MSIVIFLLVLIVLIFVHEFGHFIAAISLGMRAEVFAVGMGSRLFGWNKKTGFSFGKFIGFGKYALQRLGVDLKAPEKTKIYSVNDGKVAATLELSNYGKTVIIDHGLDIFSLYLHLDEFKVSVGDMVRRGQLIGLSGDTGYTTAPHLHFSMRVDGQRVDPIAFIETTKKISDNSAAPSLTADIANAFINLFR